MVRVIQGDESIQDSLNTLFPEGNSWNIGLVVGQVFEQRVSVVMLIPTPDESDDDTDDTGGQKSKGNIDDVHEQWVAEHARQVTRMLPGGLGVIGVFVMATDSILSSYDSKLRQHIFAVHKLLHKRDLLFSSTDSESLEWLLLQISTQTKKLVCRTINVKDPKSIPKPAELKFQSFIKNWACINCRSHIDQIIPLKERVEDCSHYSKFVLHGLQPMIEKIENSIILINGQMRDQDDTIDSLFGAKKKAGKKTQPSHAPKQPITVELLSQLKREKHGTSGKEGAHHAEIHIKGWISSRAYTSGKGNCLDIERVIKEDLRRSLQARFDLLVEELRQSSGDSEVKELDLDPPSLISTPSRVYANHPSSQISVCDYYFSDEDRGDVADRFKELINIEVSVEDLDFLTEQVPDDTILHQMETGSTTSSSEGCTSEEQKLKPGGSRTLQYVGAAVAGAGAILAVGLSYLSLSE